MNKVINFDLFLDLLTEKLDEQRTALTQKQFEQIEFGTHGYPKIIIQIFCFLSRIDEEEMTLKKLE